MTYVLQHDGMIEWLWRIEPPYFAITFHGETLVTYHLSHIYNDNEYYSAEFEHIIHSAHRPCTPEEWEAIKVNPIPVMTLVLL